MSICMASAYSCVDRLSAEGGRDPASQLTQPADRREGTSDVRKDRREKAGKVEKTEERDRSRCCAQTAKWKK